MANNPEESKEVYRKEEQPWNVCLDIPKFNFSRLEDIFKEIKIRHVHDKEDKNPDCKNIKEEIKVDKCMVGKKEEEPKFEETQGRDTQEESTEDQNHKPMVDEQEADTLDKALAAQGKIYEEEEIVEESLQQEIMDDEIDDRSMASSTSSTFKFKGREAQYRVKIDKKLGQFMEQHKSSLVSPMPSAIVLASKSNYSSNRSKQKQNHEYHSKIEELDKKICIPTILKNVTNEDIMVVASLTRNITQELPKDNRYVVHLSGFENTTPELHHPLDSSQATPRVSSNGVTASVQNCLDDVLVTFK
eukprot:Gb_09023 [translate_table: standard]